MTVDQWTAADHLIDAAPVSPRPWRPVDLSTVLSGSWLPAVPTVGRRSDGVGLFYPGKVHTVSAESEAGKTWLTLSACLDEITAGSHVLYVDFEDDEGGIVNRLLAMQLQPELIRDRFHYLRPTVALGTGIHLDDLRAVLTEMQPTLVVLDGVTEAMTLHGMDPLSNKDIATFGRILPRPIADVGPAVVCLDHVVKSAESRGRYALGGVHKLNGLDGAAFVLEGRKPLGIGLTGITTVRIAKDRPGQLRKHGLPGRDGMFWFADLRVTTEVEGMTEIEVVAPEIKSDTPTRPTRVMANICQALADKGDMSGRQIEVVVTGKSRTIRDAIALLQVGGYVSNGTPIRLLKPFDESES